jgi:hypothetical protein
MTVYELVDALGGELVANRALVRRGNDYITLGEMVDGEMTLTEAGAKLVASITPEVPVKPVRQTRTRRFTPIDVAELDDLAA